MKKLVCICCFVALAWIGCVMPAHASETTTNSTEITETVTEDVTKTTPETNTTDAAIDITETDEGESTEATLSGMLANFLEEKGGDICSVLSIICSIVVAVLFKKGLLPSLSNTLTHMATQVKGGLSELESMGKSLEKSADTTLSAFTERITPTLTKVGEVAEQAEALAALCQAAQDMMARDTDARKHMEEVLCGQMDLFYQFFLSVNLPQYQKDRLGEAYTQWRAKLFGGVSHEEPTL